MELGAVYTASTAIGEFVTARRKASKRAITRECGRNGCTKRARRNHRHCSDYCEKSARQGSGTRSHRAMAMKDEETARWQSNMDGLRERLAANVKVYTPEEIKALYVDHGGCTSKHPPKK